MSKSDQLKRGPWGRLSPEQYVATGEVRFAKDALEKIHDEMLKVGKELSLNLALEQSYDGLRYELLKGDIDVMRTRVANLVGRANEELERQGRKARLTYENMGHVFVIEAE